MEAFSVEHFPEAEEVRYGLESRGVLGSPWGLLPIIDVKSFPGDDPAVVREGPRVEGGPPWVAPLVHFLVEVLEAAFPGRLEECVVPVCAVPEVRGAPGLLQRCQAPAGHGFLAHQLAPSLGQAEHSVEPSHTWPAPEAVRTLGRAFRFGDQDILDRRSPL